MTTPLPYYISNPGATDAPPVVPPVDLRSRIAALPSAPTLAPPTISAPMQSSAPALSAPIAPFAQPNQVMTDQDKLNHLRNTGAGVDQIHNPLLRGVAKAGDILSQIAGSVFLPARAIGAAIPGTTFHHQLLMHQAQNNLAEDQANQTAQTAQQNMQAQEQERQAQAARQTAQGDADAPFPISPAQAAIVGHPELAGTQTTMRDYNKLVEAADRNATTQVVGAGHDATKVTTTGMNNDTSTANNAASITGRQSISDAANKTRVLVAQMHDATSQANNANTNNHKGVTADGNFKVPADVTKRAALANNVTENADAVDSLINQHPDIVGATGGRYTSVQQMIGSDDPNIAELGVRMHNIALASNGAHGVRSAQAINQTEDELFNHFKTGPNGIHSALNATRGSMKTFLDDEQNFSSTGQRKPSGSGSSPQAPAAGGKADFVYVPGKGLVKQ